MMLSTILTLINIGGCLATIVCLVIATIKYHIAPRMVTYVVLNLASMSLLLYLQAYTLTRPPVMQVGWIYKLPLVFWWVKTLYFAWAVRFSSLKKH